MRKVSIRLFSSFLAASAVIGGLWLLGLNMTPLSLKVDVLYHSKPIDEIYAQQTIGQTFLAPYEGLCRLDVYLANHGRQNSGTVDFVLKSTPGAAEVLVHSSFSAESIRGDMWQSLQFEPLTGSANHSYYFELRAVETVPVPGNALTAYFQPQSDYANGQAYIAGVPVEGDLVFTARFCVPPWERAVIWLEQVSAGKPGVFGQSGFVLLLGAVGVALLVMVWHAVGIADEAG